MALNCWEFKKCGREIDGINSKEFGVCPVVLNKTVNSINSGNNGGRCCWAISGSLCGGIIQGTFASKMFNCLNCEFYKIVRKEEKEKKDYIDTKEILDLLSPKK